LRTAAVIYGLDCGAAGGGRGCGSSTMKRVTICAFVAPHREHTGDYYNNMIFHHSS